MQDSSVTVQWALSGLERAIQALPQGSEERRVRSQFHQLLLAIERDSATRSPDEKTKVYQSED